MAGYVLDPNKVGGSMAAAEFRNNSKLHFWLLIYDVTSLNYLCHNCKKRLIFIIDKSPVKVIRNEVYQVSGFPQSTNWKLTGKVTLYSNFMYVKNT